MTGLEAVAVAMTVVVAGPEAVVAGLGVVVNVLVGHAVIASVKVVAVVAGHKFVVSFWEGPDIIVAVCVCAADGTGFEVCVADRTGVVVSTGGELGDAVSVVAGLDVVVSVMTRLEAVIDVAAGVGLVTGGYGRLKESGLAIIVAFLEAVVVAELEAVVAGLNVAVSVDADGTGLFVSIGEGLDVVVSVMTGIEAVIGVRFKVCVVIWAVLEFVAVVSGPDVIVAVGVVTIVEGIEVVVSLMVDEIECTIEDFQFPNSGSRVNFKFNPAVDNFQFWPSSRTNFLFKDIFKLKV